MMPRPPRPSSQLFREEEDLKRRQLRRERLLWGALAALAAAAAVLQPRGASPAPTAATSPPSASSSSSAPLSSPPAGVAAGHRLRSSALPPSFGEGAEGYFPRGCVWRSVRERAPGEGASSSSGGVSNSRGSVSSSSRQLPPLEFYLEETKSWTLEMPEACTIAGDPKFRGGGGKQAAKKGRRRKRTETKASENAAASDRDLFPFPLSSTSQSCDALACTYRGGLWLSGRGRWHSIIEGGGESGSAAAAAEAAAGGGGGRIPAAGRISRNLRLAPLRVAGSAGAFASAVASRGPPEEGEAPSLRLVAGRTLVLDFGFYRHPSAIGHWAEAAGQLASHVFAETRGRSERDGYGGGGGGENGGGSDDGGESGSESESGSTRGRELRHRFDRVVLLHVSRRHFGEWARAALAAALGVEPGGSLPPVSFQQGSGVDALSDLRPPPPLSPSSPSFSPPPSPSPSSSPCSPPTIEQREAPTRARLEGVSPRDWLVFEEVSIVRDAATGGPRFAAPAAAARAWRRRFFALHGVPVPEQQRQRQRRLSKGQGGGAAAAAAAPPPPTVLYLRKREDRRVLNEAALLESLRSRLGARVVATDFLSSSSSSSSSSPSSSSSSCSHSSSSSPPFSSPVPVPVREQLLLLSRADVLLSAHTSALAGALFLRQKGRRRGRGRRPRPGGERAESEEEDEEGATGADARGAGADEAGAAVVELLQSNWGDWGSLDESFRALTSSFDDDEAEGGGRALRHGSWRATRRRHGAYPNRRDGARFGSWGGDGDSDGDGSKKKKRSLCASEGCVEAHTRVDLVVDVEGVTELVGRALRGEEVGWGVESGGG